MDDSQIFSSLLQVSTDEASIKKLESDLPYFFKLLASTLSLKMSELSQEELSANRNFVLGSECLINLCGDPSITKSFISSVDKPLLRSLFDHLLKNSLSGKNNVNNLTTSALTNITSTQFGLETFCSLTEQENYLNNLCNLENILYLLPLLLNLSVNRRVRIALCSNSEYITHIITLLDNPDEDICFTTYSLIKNCCFEDSFHSKICQENLGLIDHLLFNLCNSSHTLSDDEKKELSICIQTKLPSCNLVAEPSLKIKFVICETLLQLCSTSIGRTFLRNIGAYYILREVHKCESRNKSCLPTSQDNSHRNNELGCLVFIVEQIVDQLLCEEGDRPPDLKDQSLRSVEIDADLQAKLENAKSTYILQD